MTAPCPHTARSNQARGDDWEVVRCLDCHRYVVVSLNNGFHEFKSTYANLQDAIDFASNAGLRAWHDDRTPFQGLP